MDISVERVELDGDELEFDVDVCGYHEVEINENERVSFSVDNVLSKIDDERLLNHVHGNDEDAIREYAEKHDIKLGEGEKSLDAESFEKWLRESDTNVVTAMRTLNKVLAA